MKKKVISISLLLGMMIQLLVAIPVAAATDLYGYYSASEGAYVINRISTTDDVAVIDSDEEALILGDGYGSSILSSDTCREISMPNTVIKIGHMAFSNCANLRKITFSTSLESIGFGAFDSAGLTSVDLPDSLESIGEYAFRGTKLTMVTVPGSVKTLVDGHGIDGVGDTGGTFSNCLSLQGVTLSQGVKTLGDYTFYGCVALSDISLASSVATIGKGAFENCTALESIDLPDGLLTIEADAFKNCGSLSAVTIPASVNTLTAPMFTGCTLLTGIDVAKNNALYASVDGVLFTKDKLTLIEYPAAGETEYTVPQGTTVVGAHAFYNNASIQNVILSKGVRSIGENAFNGCKKLESIVIPSSVTSIGKDAFASCKALTTVYYAGTAAQWSKLSSAFGNTVEVVYVTEPQFTSQPAKVTVKYGQDAKITIKAIGTDLVYQWYRVDSDDTVALSNGLTYQGTNSATLTVDGAENTCNTSGKYSYYCVISNMLGSETGIEIPVYVSHTDADGVWSYNAGSHWSDCYCDVSFARGDHSGSWTVTKKATYTATGTEKMFCDTCGYVMATRSIPKLKNTSNIFTDISTKDWYYKNGAIDYVYNEGLFGGTSETTFEPKTNMTRGMFVTVLGRLYGAKVNHKIYTKFNDVKYNQYYTGYVKWASDAKIVNGTSNTTFSPDANVTREQICKMMVEYCNYVGINLRNINAEIYFADSKWISGYAKGYVKTCQRAGLVNGERMNGKNYFNPQGNATRAEVATILMNFSKNYLH